MLNLTSLKCIVELQNISTKKTIVLHNGIINCFDGLILLKITLDEFIKSISPFLTMGSTTTFEGDDIIQNLKELKSFETTHNKFFIYLPERI